jgi:serine/threonine protein kinase
MGEDVQCGHCDEIVSVPSSRLSTGSVIGDFALLEELGRGGMGVVYLAHQISLDRPAALKILQDSYANNAEFVVNFIKEARAAAKLNHPHIVQAYAVGEDEGIFYYAMEYINGDTMKDVLKRDKVIPIDKAVTIIQQIGEALDCAWKEQKLIHRDIKPDNIILAKNNRAKLADLGLSRVAGDMDDENEEEVMGTPQYISPEHLTGAPMDIRSDIYSLGATFYQFVTGRFPYEGRTANEIARKHLEATLTPPQVVNPKVPEAIGQIIMKMMKKNINERYQDAEELVEDLRLFRRGKLSSTGAVPKVFSTRTRNIPKDKGGADEGEKAPLDADFPTTTTGNLKPLYTVSTASTATGLLFSDELEGTFKKPRKKLIMYSAITIALIILVGAGLVWFYILPLGEEVEPAQIPPVIMPVGRTFRQEYLNAVNTALADYQGKKISAAMFLTKADAIIEDFPNLLPGKEEKTFKKLMAVYVPLDEKTRVAPARDKLRKEHLAAIAARKKKEEAERLAKEKAARAAEELRRKQAEAAAERERQLAIKRQQDKIRKLKIEKRTADYKKDLAKRKKKLTYNFIEFAAQKKYDAVEKMLTEAAGEPAKVSKFSAEEKKMAKGYADYAKELQKAFKRGLAVTRDFAVDNKKLVGMGMEFDRYKYGRIVKLENGTVFVKMPDEDIEKVQFADIKDYYLRKFFKIFVKKHKIKDDYFYYLLFNGFFDKNIAKYAEDDFWKKELENFEQEYFAEKLENSDFKGRQELAAKFGGLEAFKKAQKDL